MPKKSETAGTGRKRFPPIPKEVHAPGGLIAVRKVPQISISGQECWGIWEDHERRISLDQTASAQHLWKVYFHELTHAWLDDSGISNGISDELNEAICDAIAAGRMRERFG